MRLCSHVCGVAVPKVAEDKHVITDQVLGGLCLVIPQTGHNSTRGQARGEGGCRAVKLTLLLLISQRLLLLLLLCFFRCLLSCLLSVLWAGAWTQKQVRTAAAIDADGQCGSLLQPLQDTDLTTVHSNGCSSLAGRS